MAAFRQGKAVHHRHADVRYHNVRVLFLNGFQRFGPVAGGADYLVAQFAPVQHALHANQHQRFIIH